MKFRYSTIPFAACQCARKSENVYIERLVRDEADEMKLVVFNYGK